MYTGIKRDTRRRVLLLLVVLATLQALVSLVNLASASRINLPAGMICVKPGGGDGCQATISQALALAQKNDEIRVAGGIYTENILISQTVILRGGWSADFSMRDQGQFSSTIVPADNTKSVVAISGQFSSTSIVAPTLDGFVITGGRADLGSNHGGGLSIRDSDAIIISNTIKNNVAFLLGGGVWVQRGAPRIQGNLIMDNLSVGLGQDAHGGGVRLENSRSSLVTNLIAGNMVSGTESFGGGIEIAGSGGGEILLSGNLVFSNTAGLQANPGFGGGIALSSGQIRLTNSRFISNTATMGGGAIFIRGGFEDCCNMSGGDNVYRQNSAARGGAVVISGTVANCCSFSERNGSFQFNSANQGGALYLGDQLAVLDGSLVFSNTAAVDGGGVYIAAGGSISLTNSAAIANRAGQDGGAIRSAGNISLTNSTISGNKANGMGGGIYNFDSAFLLNATISDNSSSDGAGIFNANLVTVRNSLIGLNIGDNCSGGLFSLGNNLEDGGTCGMFQGTDQSNTPTSMDSLSENGGATPTHALMAGSPAIDNGDNAACSATDQRGAPRPVDGDGNGSAVCDIGAYEFLPPLYLPLVLR